ncbi:HD family phosphohydrolase [Candidatus Viridilinea mediisalina]|uniref:Phosphohydrolase n=1 Tax=Candidatus Viridilinea mediisalina TaxID=2024553 RepID=A0A2A6RHA5_9CHLR|nr:HDIG domain-containing metalloprotein [Candidatus Viridilinea mediisalina]PDW02447.1 phosphohydrolase [Candidatus Viridilinea mediisalina]
MNTTRRRWLSGMPHFRPIHPVEILSQRLRLTLFLEWLLLMVGIWAALTLSLPGQYGHLEVGMPSPISIWAPVEVAYTSEVLTAERQAQAENSSDNLVYVYDPQLPMQQRQYLVILLDTISSVRDDPSLSRAGRLAVLAALPNASLQLSEAQADLILTLDDASWEQLRSQTVGLYDRAIERYDYALDERALVQLRERWLTYWLATTSLSPNQRELAKFFTDAFLRVNRALDEEATAQRRQEARNNVAPQSARVLAGERIVSAGEIITPVIIEKLQRTGAMPSAMGWTDIAGRGMLAGLLALGFVAYMLIFEPQVALRPRSFIVMIIIIDATLLIARVTLPQVDVWSHFFPLATVAIIFAVVFNGRLSMSAMALICVAIGVMVNMSLAVAVILFATCVVAILIARNADRIFTFALAGMGVAVVAALAQLAFWFMDAPSVTMTDLRAIMLPLLFYAGLNGALSMILSLGVFNLVSRAAGQVTPLQLMELAHPSRPLLRKLIREAPGTYYHSVAVGNLAEAAAEAVGGDALLLRVAAYYHDIGKTVRPYFFTDNQTGRENVHNDLDPVTSAQIIIDHVREGVKMARAAGLPPQIVDFIATHHGTGLIRHFYQQALQLEDSVREADFRYPGPRPQTREQAILMLADSVEATVRSKAQHGKLAPARSAHGAVNGLPPGVMSLDDLVQSIIETRVREGELDQAPLTMHELSLIKQAFVVSLQSIYHPRVDYAPSLVTR